MRTSRRLLAAPAMVALLGALAACASTTPEVNAGSSAPVPSSKPSQALMTQEPAAEPERVFLTAENIAQTIADAQEKAGSYDFTMTVAADGYVIQGAGSAHMGAEPAVAMVLSSPDTGDVEIRVLAGQVYLNFGAMTGGKFVLVDPADTTSPLAGIAGGLAGQVDPTKAIAQTRAGIVAATKAGPPEQIDGVLAQPYEVVIELAKLPEEALAPFAEAEAAGIPLPAEIVYTYWLGPDDLLRKVTYDLLGAATEMTFTNWGSGTAIQAPAADEITTEDPFGT